ncbi:MAG: DUF819 family protein [bacterium]|nr:DUF819 family protein [bacterium]
MQILPIQDPTAIFVFLISLVGLIFWLGKQPKLQWLFKYLPTLIWTYFLPMICATIGILPAESVTYDWLKNYLLPGVLIILLISADIKSILKLGKIAILMMLAGTIGIILGAPIATFIFHKWLPADAWKGIGALAGSWIGGSANMIAIKEGFGTPSEIFSACVVVDTVVAYSWLGIIIALSAYQQKIDTWNKADRSSLEEINLKIQKIHLEKSRPITVTDITSILAIAFCLGYGCFQLGKMIPNVSYIINHFTWAIIIASTIGIILSFTKVAELEAAGASKIGYAGLYLILASIGAQGNLRHVADYPIFLAVGVVWILIHGLCMFVAARWLRAPMFFIATGSQANIGGTSSAPVVASIYQSSLASVGLLLAILGYMLGVYGGIIAGLLAKIAQFQ